MSSELYAVLGNQEIVLYDIVAKFFARFCPLLCLWGSHFDHIFPLLLLIFLIPSLSAGKSLERHDGS